MLAATPCRHYECICLWDVIYLSVFYLQPLKCVAAGHLPVDHATNNPGVVSAIGVHCQPGGKLLGFTGKQQIIALFIQNICSQRRMGRTTRLLT